MKARLGIVGLGLAVCLFSCGGKDPGSDAGVDAGSMDAGGDAVDAGMDAGVTDAGTDAGLTDAGTSCSGFVTDAGEVTQMYVATPTPVGDGGMIVDGVYDLTAWSVYTGINGATGPTGRMVSATQVMQGSTFRYNHRVTQAGIITVLDTNGTFTPLDGGALVTQQLCPPGVQPFTSYATNGTDLVFYSVNPPWGLAFRRR